MYLMQIIESFGDKRPDAAIESAEIQQLKSLLQEREKEIEKLEVIENIIIILHVLNSFAFHKSRKRLNKTARPKKEKRN